MVCSQTHYYHFHCKRTYGDMIRYAYQPTQLGQFTLKDDINKVTEQKF